MILEVQIQNLGVRALGAPVNTRQSFHFWKIPGGLNINIFCENWYEASSYNKKQTQKYEFKFEFQNYFIFTPEKAHFWFLKKNTQKKCFLRVSALIQL